MATPGSNALIRKKRRYPKIYTGIQRLTYEKQTALCIHSRVKCNPRPAFSHITSPRDA